MNLLKSKEWMQNTNGPYSFFISVGLFWNLDCAGVFGFLINPFLSPYIHIQGTQPYRCHAPTPPVWVYMVVGHGFILICFANFINRGGKVKSLQGIFGYLIWAGAMVLFQFNFL